MDQIESTTIKPHDCVMAFGIPTSKQAFFSSRYEDDKGFAGLFNGVWLKYQHDFANPLQDILPTLTALKVAIVFDLTLDRFRELFLEERYKVFILFSHWKNDSVEFFDGFAKISDIVENIPKESDKIIDLCVCQSDPLKVKLKQNRPNCLVRSAREIDATPHLWLKFYWALFRHLNRKNISYTQALKDTAVTFMKTTKK